MYPIELTPEETKFFMEHFSVCDEGVMTSIELGTFGMKPDNAIEVLKAAGHTEFVAWLRMIKKTEAYIRWHGKEITMGTYQVFNPMTGQHIDCETEEDVKAAMTSVAQQILDSHSIDVCRSISNEHGDSTWIPVQTEVPYMVTQKP